MILAISLDSAATEKELVLLFVFNNLDFMGGLRGLSCSSVCLFLEDTRNQNPWP